jgi:capsular exopolysaccharide synthesis family protein
VLDPTVVNTQLNIIRSQEHLARVMQDLRLLEDPRFNPALRPAEEAEASWTARLAGLVVDTLRQGWLVAAGFAQPAKPESPKPEPSQADGAAAAALESFADGFVAKQDDESRVITLRFTSPDPRLAARVVNRAAELYLERQTQTKLEQTGKVSAWIQERIAVVAEEVRRAEQAVEEYRARAGLAGTEGAAAADDRALAELNAELAAREGELLELRSKLAMARRLQARGDTDGVLGIVSSPILASLREQELQLVRREAELASSYGARHPQMLLVRSEKAQVAGRIGRELDRLVQDLSRQVELAEARRAQLEAQLEARRAQGHTQGVAAVGLREREREAQASRELLQRFLQHDKEIGDQQALIGPDARIIAVAQPPEYPSSLSPKLFSLVGFTMSFAASSLLALLLEGMDRRVRSARQLERLFGLKVLDAVPRARERGRRGGAYRYLRSRPNSAYANALRSVHAALQLGGAEAAPPPQVVLVSSALSGEGKTTFAVGLAATAAQWDRRVLVVDLDLHHPRVAESADVATPAAPGVAELVAGTATVEQAVVRTDGGFDVLGARRTRNPTGLIASPRMRQVLEELRARYDLIVIDTAPLLAVSDGRVAARLADKVLYVARWRRTPVSAVRRALQILHDARAELAGLVLLAVNNSEYMYYENEDGANYHRNFKKYYVD